MAQQAHQTSLITVLFTDLVGSTALKHEVGDQAATSLVQKYRQLLREILSRFSGSQEIETAGDSFLIEFTKPSEAVRFALLVQASLRQLKNESGIGLQQRIGIHLGEVVIESHSVGPKAKDLYGIPVDICARVMGLAQGHRFITWRDYVPGPR